MNLDKVMEKIEASPEPDKILDEVKQMIRENPLLLTKAQCKTIATAIYLNTILCDPEVFEAVKLAFEEWSKETNQC